MRGLKSVLMTPKPLRILVCSASDATLAFLNTMFSGFLVTLVASIQDAEVQLHEYRGVTPLDFIILDDQSESHVNDLVRFLHGLHSPSLRETKLIHLYTPTTSRAGETVLGRSAIPGVVKMTKPPRKARMLQTLAGLKDLPNTISSSRPTEVARAMEDLSSAQRTLYGNVLVAEGQYIVSSYHITDTNVNIRQSNCSESYCEATRTIPAQRCRYWQWGRGPGRFVGPCRSGSTLLKFSIK